MSAGTSMLKYASLCEPPPKILASGHFGCTFLAHMKRPSGETRQVACKVANRGPGKDEWHEITILNNMEHHPHVVKLLGLCLDWNGGVGASAIVMEYHSGGALSKFVERRHSELSADKLLVFSFVMASSVSHIHMHGVLHRDIALRNFVLSDNKLPILIDFGLSRETVEYVSVSNPVLPWRWLPFEVLSAKPKEGGVPTTRNSDVYALGLTLWQLFHQAQRPFSHVQYPAELAQALSTEPSAPLKFRDMVPQGVQALIKSMCSLEPEQRPSASSVRDQLLDMIPQAQRGPLGALMPELVEHVVVPGAESLTFTANQDREEEVADSISEYTPVDSNDGQSGLSTSDGQSGSNDSSPEKSDGASDGYSCLSEDSDENKDDGYGSLSDESTDDAKAVEVRGWTELHEASLHGNLDDVKRLLRRSSVNVNARADNGDTPLHCAAERGHLEVIKCLMSAKDIDVNVLNNGFCHGSPLHTAIDSRQVSAVKLLLQSPTIDVNMRGEDGVTPLHSSAQIRNAECIRALLNDVRTDPNPRDSEQASPIHYCEDYFSLLTFLADPRIDVNAQDENGYTPLHAAARKGSAEIVRALLNDRRTDPNLEDKNKRTPLFASINLNLCEIAGSPTYAYFHSAYGAPNIHALTQLLKDDRVDFKHVDNKGCTALDYAKPLKHRQRDEVVDLLVAHGAGKIEGKSDDDSENALQ